MKSIFIGIAGGALPFLKEIKKNVKDIGHVINIIVKKTGNTVGIPLGTITKMIIDAIAKIIEKIPP